MGGYAPVVSFVLLLLRFVPSSVFWAGFVVSFSLDWDFEF
jgi:hypothetical protein